MHDVHLDPEQNELFVRTPLRSRITLALTACEPDVEQAVLLVAAEIHETHRRRLRNDARLLSPHLTDKLAQSVHPLHLKDALIDQKFA